MTPDRRPLFALLVSTIVSLVGSQFTLIALPWFVLTTTGSASKAGLVGFASLLPALFVGIFGGVFVDRLGYRRVSIVADMVSGSAILAIPLLYSAVGMEFWQLLVLVFLGSVLKIPSLTAHRSMVPELAARAHMPLDRVNAFFESLQNLSVLLGTPIAGLLVAIVGARNVLIFDAASFGIAAFLIIGFIPIGMFSGTKVAGTGYLRETLAGLRFIRRDRLLWPMVIVLAMTNATANAVVGLLLPFYAEDHFGSAKSIGVIVAATGAGAFLGATLYGMIAGRISRRRLWQIGFMIMPLQFWIFVVSPNVASIVVAFFIVGVAIGPINPLMVTIRHERSPSELRGRVFSTYSAVAMAAAPFGILVAGYAVEQGGFTPTTLGFALVAQLVGVATLALPAFRELDSPPPATSPLASATTSS